MTTFTLAELEAAINYWRARSPSTGEEHALCAQAASLAKPYAAMIIERKTLMAMAELDEAAGEAFLAWRHQQPEPSGGTTA